MKIQPQFHLCGAGALLMGLEQGAFDLSTQQRLWSLYAKDGAFHQLENVNEIVLGVNNVMVTFDPLKIDIDHLQASMKEAWDQSKPWEKQGRLAEVPVRYDSSPEFDLKQLAQNANLSVDQVIDLHTSVDYRVACIGWLPGFAYLIGLPAALVTPRLANPRALVPKGAVGIGGEQTGIIPQELPSGWNLLGITDQELFNPYSNDPCLLEPGDRVRFKVQGASI